MLLWLVLMLPLLLLLMSQLLLLVPLVAFAPPPTPPFTTGDADLARPFGTPCPCPGPCPFPCPRPGPGTSPCLNPSPCRNPCPSPPAVLPLAVRRLPGALAVSDISSTPGWGANSAGTVGARLKGLFPVGLTG